MLKPEHQAALDKYVGTDHKGNPVDKAKLLKPNPMVAKVLVARMMSMNPQQIQALRSIVTMRTASALKVLMPELSGLIDKGATQLQGAQQQQAPAGAVNGG